MKVDILNELSSVSKDKRSKMEAEIQNNVLADVKLLLEHDAIEEKKVLQQLGMDTHIQKAENLMGTKIEMEKLEAEHGEVFAIEDIERLCLKYNLRFLPTKNYKGHISGDLAANILRFNKKNNVLDNGYDRDRFFIMAPGTMFKFDERPKPELDPVMFYQISGHGRRDEPKRYKIVHKWGNDFTVARLVSGFMNRNAGNKFLTRWFFAALAVKFVVSFFGINMGIVGTAFFGLLAGGALQLIVMATENEQRIYGSSKVWDSPYKD